uniref:Uncharacterized protein n=1 Tax=Kalanchoe fedtschenkoi TaxID=63787 RepID=A0A7N1A4T9_KALFE
MTMAVLTAVKLNLGFQSLSSIKPRIPVVLNRRSFYIPGTSSLSRFNKLATWPAKKSLPTPSASNSDPSTGEKSLQGKETGNSNVTEKALQGPPLATIVAGALVFFLVCWVVGSIITLLISPIVNLLTSK